MQTTPRIARELSAGHDPKAAARSGAGSLRESRELLPAGLSRAGAGRVRRDRSGRPCGHRRAQLIADFPDRDLDLVINARRHGANAKVSNLINMQPEARHETSGHRRQRYRSFRPIICQRHGEPQPAGRRSGDVSVSRRRRDRNLVPLAAAGIDYHFLPNVLVGLKLGLATPCFGSTIAITKTTLQNLAGCNQSPINWPTTTRWAWRCAGSGCRWRSRLSSSHMSAPSGHCANSCFTRSAGRGPFARWIH